MSSKRTRTWAVVLVATVAVAGTAVAVSLSAPADSEATVSASNVTYAPTNVIIDEVPATISVGSYTGSRAVIQMTAQTPDGKKLLESIQVADLRTDRGDIVGHLTTGQLDDGTWTLTATFAPDRPIGAATLAVKTGDGPHVFTIVWPSTSGT